MDEKTTDLIGNGSLYLAITGWTGIGANGSHHFYGVSKKPEKVKDGRILFLACALDRENATNKLKHNTVAKYVWHETRESAVKCAYEWSRGSAEGLTGPESRPARKIQYARVPSDVIASANEKVAKESPAAEVMQQTA